MSFQFVINPLYENQTTIIVLFVFLIFTAFAIIGIFIRRARFRKISEFSIILAVSIVIGIIAELFGLNTSSLYISQKALYYIIFPIVTIGFVLNVNWTLTTTIKGCFFYAFPLIIFEVFIFATILYVYRPIFSFSISLSQAITIGAVVMTTDIGALTKTLYYYMCPSDQIFIYASGERVLVFSVCSYIVTTYEAVSSNAVAFSSFAVTLGSLFLGFIIGIIIGLLFGFVGCAICLISGSFVELETFVIIGSAFLAFVFPGVFNASRGLSVVACIYIISRFCLPNISKQSRYNTYSIINGLVSVADQFVFVAIGFQAANIFFHGIPVKIDWAYFFFLFFTAFSVRFLSVFLIGRQIVAPKADSALLLLSYAQLRGAPTFLLMFEVYESNKNDVYDQTLFVVIILVITTQFVAGNCVIPFIKRRHLVMHGMKEREAVIGTVITQTISLTRSLVRDILNKESHSQITARKLAHSIARAFRRKGAGQESQFLTKLREAQVTDIENRFSIADNSAPPIFDAGSIAENRGFIHSGMKEISADNVQNLTMVNIISHFGKTVFGSSIVNYPKPKIQFGDLNVIQ